MRLTSYEMDAGHSRGLEAHLASCRCAVSHFHFHIVVEELQETGRWESDGNDHSVPVNRTTGRWQASMIAVGRRNHGKVDPLRFQTSGCDITPAVDSPTRRSPASSSPLRRRYFSAGRTDAKFRTRGQASSDAAAFLGVVGRGLISAATAQSCPCGRLLGPTHFSRCNLQRTPQQIIED